jgi:acyl-coenzyme A thioesterase PaaI-like protein
MTKAMLAGERPWPHIMRTLDCDLQQVEHGRAVFQGVLQRVHSNPLGSVHRRWCATLLDSALGCAVHTVPEAGPPLAAAKARIDDAAGKLYDHGSRCRSARATRTGPRSPAPSSGP